MDTPSFILFHTAQYLELYDVAMCMSVFRHAPAMYQNVRHTEITYYTDVEKLVKKCPKISSLIIRVDLDPEGSEMLNDTDSEEGDNISSKQEELSIKRKYEIVEVLSTLPITRLVCADCISNHLISQFKQLSYLKIPQGYTYDPELKLREIECESISGAHSDHLEKLHLDLADRSNLKKIYSLTIRNVRHEIDYLDRCPNLTSLAILNDPIDLDLKLMPFSLENLTLRDCNLGCITSNAKRDLRNLKTLVIERSNLDIGLISDLSITSLSMKNVHLSNAQKLKQMPLIDLAILDCDIDARWLLNHLPETLKSLHVNFEQVIDDEDMEILAKRENLSILTIRGSNITGEVLPPNLTDLNLMGAEITKRGLENISKLPLRTLTLSNCGLTDCMVAYLRPLTLRYLDIRKNYITAKGMTSIKFTNYRYFKHDPVSIKHLVKYLYS